MHFMLVNDDGWYADGIQALAQELVSRGHRVTICAPDRQRSGAGHALVFDTPLHAMGLPALCTFPGWMIDGSPADCARLGITLLSNDLPDMVLSGINAGANVGAASVYSGTIAAAMEASMCCVPAVAASLDTFGGLQTTFAQAARTVADFALWAYAHPLSPGAIYNINIPNCPEAEARGLRRATIAPMYLGKPNYLHVINDYGQISYIYASNDPLPFTDPDSDSVLLSQGYIPVTAMTYDCACAMDTLPQR